MFVLKWIPSHQYGTTLRCYDPAQNLWNTTWMQPYGGEFVNLVGKQVDNRIANEGIGAASKRQQRWYFSEIKGEYFVQKYHLGFGRDNI